MMPGMSDGDPAPGLIRASLLEASGVEAAFTTRALGDGLPVPESVPVFRLTQVHSNRVVHVKEDDAPPDLEPIEADALVTTRPGVALTIQVADCVPVLLALPGGRAVAAVHAGWRGIASGILTRAVEEMCAAACCQPADLVASAGPAIGPARYEVDLETGRRIRGPLEGDVLSEPYGDGRVKADLWHAVLGRLEAVGLPPGRTEAIRLCTWSHPALLHSYRRDGPRSGRQLGFVVSAFR